MPNTELFQKVVDQIEGDPDGFDMGTWELLRLPGEECGTTRCIAGWGLFLHHGAPLYSADGMTPASYLNGQSIASAAAGVFGISRVLAGALFYHRGEVALEASRRLAAGADEADVLAYLTNA